MEQRESENSGVWDEQDSRRFIDYGHYFVPERELQIKTLCDLIEPIAQPFHVRELCCGEGLLAEALVERFPGCIVHGYDGSQEMLQHARTRLARYGQRFVAELFDLASSSWRGPAQSCQVVVSSLAIHHLDGQQKQELFRDVHRMLDAGGLFLIADVIEPASERGLEVAAGTWDETVRQRSMELHGDTRAFDLFLQEKWNMYRHMDDPLDKPSRLFDQLKWLERAGFVDVDVFWMKAGHAIFGGRKATG